MLLINKLSVCNHRNSIHCLEINISLVSLCNTRYQWRRFSRKYFSPTHQRETFWHIFWFIFIRKIGRPAYWSDSELTRIFLFFINYLSSYNLFLLCDDKFSPFSYNRVGNSIQNAYFDSIFLKIFCFTKKWKTTFEHIVSD